MPNNTAGGAPIRKSRLREGLWEGRLMPKRHVAGASRLHAHGEADQPGLHGVERVRLGIERDQPVNLRLRHPLAQRVRVLHQHIFGDGCAQARRRLRLDGLGMQRGGDHPFLGPRAGLGVGNAAEAGDQRLEIHFAQEVEQPVLIERALPELVQRRDVRVIA